jgi:alpha-ketoglutarate-dependent taurine dioxygenase
MIAGTGHAAAREEQASVPIADEIEHPSAWTAAMLDAESGSLRLNEACLAELDTVAAELVDNPLPTIALRPADFAMPQCRAAMERARIMLRDGVGFVLLDKLPLAPRHPEISIALYWLLASMVARPVAQKWDGRMIYDVRDTGKKPGNGVRPDITNVEQNFHTDNSYNLCPPDYVSLLCLQKSMEGGISRIISFPAVHNIMRERHPDFLARLYRPYWFDRQREHAPDDVRVISHAVFASENGDLLARHSRFQIENGHDLAGEPIDDEGQAALAALEEVMADPALWKEFVFEPGQIQILDNRRCGHKRTAFRDFPEPDRKRHLVRLWLRHRGLPFYNG